MYKENLNRFIGYSIVVPAFGAFIGLTVTFMGNLLKGDFDATDSIHVLPSLIVLGLIWLAISYAKGKSWASRPIQIMLLLIAIGLGCTLMMVIMEEGEQNLVEWIFDLSLTLMVVAPVISTAFLVGMVKSSNTE